MWTIDLATHEVVDTFQLSMGGKKFLLHYILDLPTKPHWLLQAISWIKRMGISLFSELTPVAHHI
jgi:hypothetical protein